MGCDIHGVFQRFDPETEKWVEIPSEYGQDRDYQLFSVLAGVRNYHLEPIEPISRPRGLPEDFDWDDSEYPTRSVWLGDHSHSWLSGEEMLEWYSSAPTIRVSGVISQGQYISWDHVSTPYPYSQGIYGANVRVVDEGDVPDLDSEPWSHIRVSWSESLWIELAYFFDEVTRLQDKFGKVRFVFGFDS